jgi:tRNA A-37 threonylcarbamoyl transferase component Bud32
VATTVLADRYELRHQLGRGGMATVYEAHDDLLDRAVAIKLLRADSMADATARQRFAGEARNAASLSHPHAVAVYDVASSGDQPFIVMELVRGTTLEDELADSGPMDPDAVIAVGSQVLAALHAAHRKGLVHRDIKPANILLPDGVVPRRPEELPGIKLADFGIAKAAHEATVGLTMVGQVIGTPKYLSPEQVKGERATPLSDLYATGVVLYEMLAGRPPFEHDSAVALALAHREDEPPPLDELRPDLDPALVALIHQALDKDPANRPADADAMREALLSGARATTGTQMLPGPAAGTQAVTRPAAPVDPAPTEPAPAGPAAPPRRRRGGRVLVWVVVLALLTVVAYVAAQQLGGGPTTDQPTAPANEGLAPAGGQQDQQQPDQEQPQQEDPAQDAPADAATPDGGAQDDGAGDQAPPDDAAPVVPDDAPTG